MPATQMLRRGPRTASDVAYIKPNRAQNKELIVLCPRFGENSSASLGGLAGISAEGETQDADVKFKGPGKAAILILSEGEKKYLVKKYCSMCVNADKGFRDIP
jgi:hypothetical protein